MHRCTATCHAHSRHSVQYRLTRVTLTSSGGEAGGDDAYVGPNLIFSETNDRSQANFKHVRARWMDRWENSGGKKGASLTVFTPELGLRKRYGKLTLAEGPDLRFFAYCVLRRVHDSSLARATQNSYERSQDEWVEDPSRR